MEGLICVLLVVALVAIVPGALQVAISAGVLFAVILTYIYVSEGWHDYRDKRQQDRQRGGGWDAYDEEGE